MKGYIYIEKRVAWLAEADSDEHVAIGCVGKGGKYQFAPYATAPAKMTKYFTSRTISGLEEKMTAALCA